MNLENKNILITGGKGFLGKALWKKFANAFGASNLQQLSRVGSEEFDLRNFREAEKATEDRDIVIHLAASCGGIGFNQKFPGKLFYENMAMGINVVEACRRNGVKKIVIVGTICAYPKFTKVPFREEDLFLGYPEETNAPYGVAKRSLVVMAQAYRKQYGMNAIYLLPVNLYGAHDHFEEEKSHVIPALIKKFVEAKDRQLDAVVLWGTGKATREFLYVDDAAEGIFLATRDYNKPAPINLGAGFEIGIKELAEKIQAMVGFEGELKWDESKPDGQPRRCLDTSKAKELFGFEAKTPFDKGLAETIDWYLQLRSQNEKGRKTNSAHCSEGAGG